MNSLALSFLCSPTLTSIHNFWKNHSFVYTEFPGKVMVLLFNMLSKLVIDFHPRSKHLLISWLQSPLAVILEPKKIQSVTASTFSPSIFHEEMGPDAMVLIFWMSNFKSAFNSPLLLSSRGSLVPLYILPLEWYHLHIWDCWYFSLQSWFQFVIHFTCEMPGWRKHWMKLNWGIIYKILKSFKTEKLN